MAHFDVPFFVLFVLLCVSLCFFVVKSCEPSAQSSVHSPFPCVPFFVHFVFFVVANLRAFVVANLRAFVVAHPARRLQL